MKPKKVIEVLTKMKKETKIALWGITRRIENILKRNEKPLDDDYAFQKREEEKLQAIDHAINCVGAIEQIKWERDIAIDQLHELGYEFGEKVREEEYRWVDVNMGLPIESGYYLITNGAKELDIRKYDYGWFHDMHRRYTDEELKVIAWRKINPFEPLDIRPKTKI